MSHTDNKDRRNTGDGGWFYAEIELFTVFAPLIGSDGVAVYMAMCRLIPLAAVDPDKKVTVRRVEEASRVSRSQSARKMAEIVALGMVKAIAQGKNRPPAYELLSLRELAKVGILELERRLRAGCGVPPGDTAKSGNATPYVLEMVAAGAEEATGAALGDAPAATGAGEPAKAPEGSGESGVPGWDTAGESSKSCGKALEKGGLELQSGTPVSQKRASVSQKPGPLMEEEEDLKKETIPPTPARGGMVFDASRESDGKDPATETLAGVLLRDQGKSKNGNPPREGQSEADAALNAAVAKVMRGLSLSGWRLDRVIAAQMRTVVATTDELVSATFLDALAERMIAAREEYSMLNRRGLLRFGPFGLARFIGEGIWRDQGLWGIDMERYRMLGG